MSSCLEVEAFSGRESAIFDKHYKAVKFCLENDLSFPKETSLFFKGKLPDCDNLEEMDSEHILEAIENGTFVEIKLNRKDNNEVEVFLKDIPAEVDRLIIRYR